MTGSKTDRQIETDWYTYTDAERYAHTDRQTDREQTGNKHTCRHIYIYIYTNVYIHKTRRHLYRKTATCKKGDIQK